MNQNEIAAEGQQVIDSFNAKNMTDQEVLNKTREIKLRLLDGLVDEHYTPDDPKVIRTILEITNSLDNVAITNIRMNQEAADGAAAQEAIRILGEMTRVLGNSDPYRSDNQVTREVTIESKLIETSFVPGETSTEARDIEYGSFVKKFEDEDGDDA